MADPFPFELVSPERLLMSEKVEQVVVPGAEGYFTVLAGHAPYMSTLKPGVVEVTRGGSVDRIFVRGGFADVNVGGLMLLAEQAIPVADIDPAMLAEDIRNAEDDVRDVTDATVKAEAESRLQQLREVQAAVSS